MIRFRRTRGRRLTLMVAGVAGVAAAAAGIGWGAGAAWDGPDADGVFHACVNRLSGEVKLVNAGVNCSAGSAAASWSQAGEPGPTGAAGPAGPTGPSGPAGAPGSTVVGVYQSSGFFQSTKLGGTYTEVARTALEPGNWLVTVNATLANYKSGAWTPVGCMLGTSQNPDQERGFVDLGPLADGGDTQRMTITSAVRTTDPTDAILGCFANIAEPNTEAFHVQFSAVKIDNLTVRRTSDP